MADIEIQRGLWPDIPPVRAVPARIREVGRHCKGRLGLQPAHRDMPRFVSLVLASGSPSRLDVLRLLGLRFRVHPAEINEDAIKASTPEALVLELSRQKATAVADEYSDALVIGADSVICHEGNILGKPRDMNDAKRMLSCLSGATHEVITGLTIVDRTRCAVSSREAKTRVTFRVLSEEAIERYAATGEPLGKAGAYALQGTGALLVKRIDGEYSNVLGLPVATLVDLLDELGYELL